MLVHTSPDRRPRPDDAPRTATRRTLIAGLLAAPAVAAGARAMARLRKNAAAVRPSAAGSSTTRCAACGETGHSMLTCPAAPKVV